MQSQTLKAGELAAIITLLVGVGAQCQRLGSCFASGIGDVDIVKFGIGSPVADRCCVLSVSRLIGG